MVEHVDAHMYVCVYVRVRVVCVFVCSSFSLFSIQFLFMILGSVSA